MPYNAVQNFANCLADSGLPGSAGLPSPLLSAGLELVLVASVEAEADEAVMLKGEGTAAEERGDREEADLEGAGVGPGAGVGAAEEAGVEDTPALVQLLGAEAEALLVLVLLLVVAALAMVVWV